MWNETEVALILLNVGVCSLTLWAEWRVRRTLVRVIPASASLARTNVSGSPFVTRAGGWRRAASRVGAGIAPRVR
jgi:hypothetical protein